MTGSIRLTAAQAHLRWLSVQMTEDGERLIDGVWAIFGHSNVPGLGEDLHGLGNWLASWRVHNEQSMVHAAIAYAKTMKRHRGHAVGRRAENIEPFRAARHRGRAVSRRRQSVSLLHSASSEP